MIRSSPTFNDENSSPSGLSAGSVTLIIQTLLWPLAFAGVSSKITARGGTFVPFSPPFHYLSKVVQPVYKLMGLEMDNKLVQWGWMSAGGGCVEINVDPTNGLQAVNLEPIAVEKVPPEETFRYGIVSINSVEPPPGEPVLRHHQGARLGRRIARRGAGTIPTKCGGPR